MQSLSLSNPANEQADDNFLEPRDEGPSTVDEEASEGEQSPSDDEADESYEETRIDSNKRKAPQPIVTTEHVKKKKVGRGYMSITSKKVSSMMSSITTMKVQEATDEQVLLNTQAEMRKLNEAELLNILQELVKISDLATKDNNKVHVNNLISKNEPHIHNIVINAQKMDVTTLRTKLNDAQTKMTQIKEMLRQLEEVEQLLTHLIDERASSKYAQIIMKQAILRIQYERFDAIL